MSNTGTPSLRRRRRRARWKFPDTPPLSTYVPVVNAGPFVEMRCTRGRLRPRAATRGGRSRRCSNGTPRSSSTSPRRDSRSTASSSRLPFPQPRYDQVFVPEFGGAMENYGCVTWSDVFVYRDPPSYTDREQRAMVLLHEMAHMWFGDIVTMRWWDDLWLNEAFAEWACDWCGRPLHRVRRHVGRDSRHREAAAYAADTAPTTHPIRQAARRRRGSRRQLRRHHLPQGRSVLKQLVAFVGEDAFVAGLRSYFAKHAWGNTTLDDLMRRSSRRVAVTSPAGPRAGWTPPAPTDSRSNGSDGGRRPGRDAAGRPGAAAAPPADRRVRRPATTGSPCSRRCPSRSPANGRAIDGGADADLLLVNDDDLTFATVRPDPASLEILLTRGGELPSAVGRTVGAHHGVEPALRRRAERRAVRRLRGGRAHARDGRLRHRAPARPARRRGRPLGAHAAREQLQSRVSDLCISLAETPGRRLAALRGLAQSATTPAQLEFLATHATEPGPAGGDGSSGSPSSISSTSRTSSRCSTMTRTPTRG